MAASQANLFFCFQVTRQYRLVTWRHCRVTWQYRQVLPSESAISLSVAKFCPVLGNIAECCRVTYGNIAKCCQVIGNITKYCQVLPSVAGSKKTLVCLSVFSPLPLYLLLSTPHNTTSSHKRGAQPWHPPLVSANCPLSPPTESQSFRTSHPSIVSRVNNLMTAIVFSPLPHPDPPVDPLCT
jgi:hypothetical protein